MMKPKHPKRGDVSRNVIVEYKRRPLAAVAPPETKEEEAPVDNVRPLKASLGERVAARK